MAELLDSLLSGKIFSGLLAETTEKDVKVKQSELLFFSSQLSVMLSSGVVLNEAVEAIVLQTKPGVFRGVLFGISDGLQNGESFSSALSAFPKVFNPMFIGMIAASEASGRMPEVLTILQKYIEDEVNTKKQIKGALIYPVIMMIMAIVATTTLLFFVLPKFTKIYEARGQALPMLTQILVGFGKLVSSLRSVSVIFTVLIIIGGAVFYFLNTPWGKRVLDYLKIHTPVFGTMFVDTVMTRSTRIMATMLKTGVTLLETLYTVENACDNEYFSQFWAETRDRVEAGFQFSEAMNLASYSQLIPHVVIQMIQAGEKSGNLGSVCERISNFYDEKLKGSIKSVVNLIEPLMIIIMGIIIGTITIALLLPIFKISTLVGR
ncbi:MAG: type II secretion system F family protein [Sedimentisphaerales bacterium]|nr:type II secretion system F family protein [Sedimentisphaerales bacterium]